MNFKQEPQINTLDLSYKEYVASGKTIARSRIGKYIVYDELGKGAFGAVYEGMDDQTKQTVAIKVLDLEAVQKQHNQRIKQIRRRLCKTESQLMMLCNSDNVIKCYHVYENKSLKIMVIEYCNGGDLQKQIKEKIRIPEKEAILILKQIINGISQLHTHKIIHRDLKAENILSHNGVYKIADLGFSKQVSEDQEMKGTTLGTITTMAPQVMKKHPYGLKADIWSIGIIFFQMIYGKVPYTSTNAIQMYNEIQTKKILENQNFKFNNHQASKKVIDFLKEIIIIDKTKRLGWKQLIKHPIFDETDDRLNDEFRLNFQLKGPQIKIDQQVENNTYEKEEVQDSQQYHLKVKPDGVTHQLIRLTIHETQLKKKQVKNREDQLYDWVRQTHLECLKTQLIFDKVFQRIEDNNLLDISERSVVEFMYLIITRCLNNISVINDKIKSEQKNTALLINLNENVKKLYGKINKAWSKYSKMLTIVENKMGSIISDRFMKIFSKKSLEEKDKYLTGIQKMYYTKQQQIRWTSQNYIEQIISEMRKEPVKIVQKVKNFLSHYVEINNITLKDLKKRNFYEYVQMILQ